MGWLLRRWRVRNAIFSTPKFHRHLGFIDAKAGDFVMCRWRRAGRLSFTEFRMIGLP